MWIIVNQNSITIGWQLNPLSRLQLNPLSRLQLKVTEMHFILPMINETLKIAEADPIPIDAPKHLKPASYTGPV